MSASEHVNKCADRVGEELERRLSDLDHLWSPEHNDEENCKCETGSRWDYGLCFDYVAAGTFKDQKQGFFRYQLSTGGPGDEFRFFTDATRKPYRVEYWFLDWFDGACRVLHGKNRDLLLRVFDDFSDVGAVEKALKDAEE